MFTRLSRNLINKSCSSSLKLRKMSTIVQLPELTYDYNGLEPAISGEIMELHHSKHHQTYVNNYIAASGYNLYYI